MNNTYTKHMRFLNLCGAVLLFLVTYATGRHGVDYGDHAAIADQLDFSNIPKMLMEHSEPLWHTLTRALKVVLPLNTKQCGIIVAAFAMCAAYLITSYYMRKFAKDVPAWKVICLNVVLHLVSALYMPWFNRYVYRGQGSPNIWHNPTQTMMLPFMLLFFCILTEELEPIVASGFKKNFPLKKGCLLAVLLLLANASKPAFALAFFPGIFLLMVIYLVKSHFRSIKLAFQLLAVCMPAVLVMGLQFFAIFKSGSGKGGGIIFSPFTVASYRTPNVFFSMFLLFAFPLGMLVVMCVKRKLTATHAMALCLLAAGTAEKWLLAESGARLYHGNLSWGYGAATTLCWFVAVRDYVKEFLGEKSESGLQKTDKPGADTFALIILTLLLAYHLLSGIYYIYTIAVLGKGY